MLSDALFSSKNQCWCTPKALFDVLDSEFHFDLDPCCTDKSAKCDLHFTPETNGLIQDWGGHTSFVNPPYGRELPKWVEKSYRESKKPNTMVVMLIPARTDTSYWHEYIFHGGASEIRFIRGRIYFEDENGIAGDSSPFPSAVIVFSGESGCTLYTTMDQNTDMETRNISLFE